jgi:two-component system chemotaxis response regulator CheY
LEDVKTVLLVDDSTTIRDIVKIYLMGLPLKYIDAETGERALSTVGLMPVDLVIADVKMPGMSGIDLVRKIRAHQSPQVRKLPVVLLTSQTADTVRLQGMNAGANAILNKPISSAALLPIVYKLLPSMLEPSPAPVRKLG